MRVSEAELSIRNGGVSYSAHSSKINFGFCAAPCSFIVRLVEVKVHKLLYGIGKVDVFTRSWRKKKSFFSKMERNTRLERNTNTAACCIPQSNLMKVMSVSSLVFGAPITLISSILTYSPDISEGLASDETTLSFLRTQPFKILILVGALQAVTSVWLLSARDKRRAAKLWTIGHFLSFCSTLLYLWNLLAAKPVTNYYLKLYFYFVGINFCVLLYPLSSSADSDTLLRRDSSSSSGSVRSKEHHYEYKV